MLGDIFTIDAELIGTEVCRYVIEFSDDSYLSLIIEDLMHDQLTVEGQLVAHVEPMVEEDEQLSLGSVVTTKSHIHSENV